MYLETLLTVVAEKNTRVTVFSAFHGHLMSLCFFYLFLLICFRLRYCGTFYDGLVIHTFTSRLQGWRFESHLRLVCWEFECSLKDMWRWLFWVSKLFVVCDCALRCVATPSRLSPALCPEYLGIGSRLPVALYRMSGTESAWMDRFLWCTMSYYSMIFSIPTGSSRVIVL